MKLASGFLISSGGGGTGLSPAGETCDEPPPDMTPTSAWPPMTAMDLMEAALSGRYGALVLEENRAALFGFLRNLGSPP